MERNSKYKVYVEVTVKMDAQGQIHPQNITWEDGRVYEIDQIQDVRKACSLKAGGAGIRYTVRIGHRQTYLFYEEGRWFVERRFSPGSEARG